MDSPCIMDWSANNCRWTDCSPTDLSAVWLCPVKSSGCWSVKSAWPAAVSSFKVAVAAVVLRSVSWVAMATAWSANAAVLFRVSVRTDVIFSCIWKSDLQCRNNRLYIAHCAPKNKMVGAVGVPCDEASAVCWTFFWTLGCRRPRSWRLRWWSRILKGCSLQGRLAWTRCASPWQLSQAKCPSLR